MSISAPAFLVVDSITAKESTSLNSKSIDHVDCVFGDAENGEESVITPVAPL